MRYGKTEVFISKDEVALGVQAASDVADKIRELLDDRAEIRIIFAAAESQMIFLDALAVEKNINWQRIVCFNVDDFYDTKMPGKYTCGHLTQKLLYDKVRPKRVHLIRYNAPDPEKEARRFESVMHLEEGFDILCQGIGISGHLALNEPFDCDFNDKSWVRVVSLTEQSKNQLRNDPNFKALGYIPLKGITMTISVLMSVKNIIRWCLLVSNGPYSKSFLC